MTTKQFLASADWSDSVHTRALERTTDWAFFPPCENVAEADRFHVRPLSEAGARAFWEHWVSASAKERHPMLLDRDHWLDDTSATGPDWRDAWAQSRPRPGSATDEVATFLASNLPWPEDECAIFVWMREQASLVRIGSFLRA